MDKHKLDTLELKETKIAVEQIDNDSFFKISNFDIMRTFFMSLVSDTNIWMFLQSNGGITAGRKSSDYSLFPYYTDDKLADGASFTGCKTVMWVHEQYQSTLWEPFNNDLTQNHNIQRNIYKNTAGNKVVFEEVHHEFNLVFRYMLTSSSEYGIIKETRLHNFGENPLKIRILDGFENILPYGVPVDLQRTSSNLVDAYKRQELEKETGLGIFALSAIIVDRAEPSEALYSNVVWATGLSPKNILLSSSQVKAFINGKALTTELDVKGERGAYFVESEIDLFPYSIRKWNIVADVKKDRSQVIALAQLLKDNDDLSFSIRESIDASTSRLRKLVGSADGFQFTNDFFSSNRHFANVLFNIMRGGVIDSNYQVGLTDFLDYLKRSSRSIYSKYAEQLNSLGEEFLRQDLVGFTEKLGERDLIRLAKQYLPLKFSRRHGDPSRPWNKFTIDADTKDFKGRKLNYEGNWRDIFQNWEALAYSFPGFIDGMMYRFLNTSTFEGYNPYRINKDGYDWEELEPENPWSYIGYWGDHQVIYLLKLLEVYKSFNQERLLEEMDKNLFVYANVPYKIKPYAEIVNNPKDTITFEEELNGRLRENMELEGSDAGLLCDKNQKVHYVTLVEKLLLVILSKVGNFVPTAGIWMNTQRPEWNDANNALVGNGVSMVTLYYLRRFVLYFEELIHNSKGETYSISVELAKCFEDSNKVLFEKKHFLLEQNDFSLAKSIMDALGRISSDYRLDIYEKGFSGEQKNVNKETIVEFCQLLLRYIDHTISLNERTDKLYHAYNLLKINKEDIEIAHLSEMLEGQVAVLSSGYLKANQAAILMDAMRKSALYRADQNSYLLYPNRELPGFLQKNIISERLLKSSELLQKLLSLGNESIVKRDLNGVCHFNGDLKNGDFLIQALTNLKETEEIDFSDKERDLVGSIYEEVFNHQAFTGRSGTFFAYEGLGSIYWHMVSKLHVAVQEVIFSAIAEKDNIEDIKKLSHHYYQIGEGIGVHKSPAVYGAFPTDPYSHTPGHKGAQQPGMTGQVKEDILVRMKELGMEIKEGEIHFKPYLLKKEEFLKKDYEVPFYDVKGEMVMLSFTKDSLGFSFCQVPFILNLGEENYTELVFSTGEKVRIPGHKISKEYSKEIFNRTGGITKILVNLKADTYEIF